MLKNTIAILVTTASFLFMGTPNTSTQADQNPPIIKEDLSHQQQVWISALEWCESRAINGAVNPKDKDGTPSYYAFQFKPSTFLALGNKYGVIDTSKQKPTDQQLLDLMKRYELQRGIVEEMVKDKQHIDWQNQFPACVRQLGMPPK